MLSLNFLLVLMFFSALLSIVITSLGKERAGLYAFPALFWSSCMLYFLSFFFPLGVRG